MENSHSLNKKEVENQNKNYFPVSISNSFGNNQNPISYLPIQNSELPPDDKYKNNLFIQKRNRTNNLIDENIEKSENNVDSENKNREMNDSNSDNNISMKSPDGPQKIKLYQMNPLNYHEQFICKKMSIDLDDDATNPNVGNKKAMGCNCKNSGCLKRYCECFSKMKYCEGHCQCKNCLNNIKFEKERSEAIRIYLVKSSLSFKKINLDLNNITCNCKKSNCLKNYCECFQFGLKCTYNCGCVDCKNRNLFEKKLFFVENNCNSKKGTNQINENSHNIAKININQNKNLIKLQEDEQNINNGKINNIDKIQNIKKNINNPQFIVNNNNIINSILPSKLKNRTRFFSFDDDILQISQWNNLNLKKIEISNNKLIINNYNINNPDDIGNSYQGLQPNIGNNFFNSNNNNNLNSNDNNMIFIRKNSAFSAIIK